MCTDLVKTCSCAPDLIGIWKCWFLKRAGLGKSGVPREKPLGREPTTNSTHIIMTPGPGIGPGPHWWEANALTTAPSVLRSNIFMVKVEKHFKTACMETIHWWHLLPLGHSQRRDYTVQFLTNTIKLSSLQLKYPKQKQSSLTLLHEYKGERFKTELVQKQNKKIFTQPFVMQYYSAVPNVKPILMNSWHFIKQQPLLNELC